MEQNNKKITTVVVLVIIFLALAFFGYQFFWSSTIKQDVVEQTVLQAEVDKVNPFNQEQLVNPFNENSNPYENIKTNPFE